MVQAHTSADVFPVPAATRFTGHSHEGLHLCAILSGAFHESVGKSETVATSGMLRVSPSARHDIRFGPEGARCLLIEVGDEDASALRHPLRKSRFLNDPWLTCLAQRLDHTLSPAGQPQVAEDLVLEILAQVSRRGIGHRTGPPPRWLTQTRDRLADEWCRPPSAEEVASAAGVHRVHLVRAFRDHFGCTLRAYVRRRRVAQAAGLLAQTDIPLSRVALECGFSDQAHLIRVLRRAIGETPLSLRRRSRVGSHVTSVQYLRHWARLV